MNRKTRKLTIMHMALHTKNDLNTFYVARKEGEIELACTKDSVDVSIQRLEDNIKKSNYCNQ